MTEMLMLAAREHLDAQMAGDADRLALTSAFPFMQVQSDGDASVYDSPEDLVDSVDGRSRRNWWTRDSSNRATGERSSGASRNVPTWKATPR